MKYIIRAARENDLPEIEEIEKACFTMPHTREQLSSCLDPNMHLFPVAVSEEGSIAGYVEMSTIIDEGYISNVAVKEECRRNGIASALLDELIQKARERELRFITLEVRESNLPAIRLYSSKNFQNVAVQKNYYSFPRENAIIMTRYL